MPNDPPTLEYARPEETGSSRMPRPVRRAIWSALLICIALVFLNPLLHIEGLAFWAIVLVGMLAVSLWLFPPEIENPVPDYLKERVGTYFDFYGFSFAPSLATDDGVALFSIHYQNRWSKPCVARLVFWPVDGLSKSGPHEVPPVSAEIRCEGAEAGTIEIPYPIGKRWQGQEMVFDLAADADFPFGGGVRVSEGAGLHVGRLGSDYREALTTGALLMIGVLRFSRSASTRVILPSGVRDHLAPEHHVRAHVWYRPGLDGMPGARY